MSDRMLTAHFPSYANAEVIEVELKTHSGRPRSVRLLVDSGFTGESELILSIGERDLAWTPISAAQTSGALEGQQRRVVVVGRVPGLSLDSAFIATLADLTQLTLPTDVGGMAGLNFLRRFARRGAERAGDGRWQFLLTESDQPTC